VSAAGPRHSASSPSTGFPSSKLRSHDANGAPATPQTSMRIGSIRSIRRRGDFGADRGRRDVAGRRPSFPPADERLVLLRQASINVSGVTPMTVHDYLTMTSNLPTSYLVKRSCPISTTTKPCNGAPLLNDHRFQRRALAKLQHSNTNYFSLGGNYTGRIQMRGRTKAINRRPTSCFAAPDYRAYLPSASSRAPV